MSIDTALANVPWQPGEVCEHGKLKRQCDECQLAYDNVQLREAVRVLGEECKQSRIHVVQAEHPDENAPPTCAYVELNTMATQADDNNLVDARKATDANPIARAAVEATGSPDPSPAPDTRTPATGEP